MCSHFSFLLVCAQPPPAPYDHSVDEREHSLEQWKGALRNASCPVRIPSPPLPSPPFCCVLLRLVASRRLAFGQRSRPALYAYVCVCVCVYVYVLLRVSASASASASLQYCTLWSTARDADAVLCFLSSLVPCVMPLIDVRTPMTRRAVL